MESSDLIVVELNEIERRVLAGGMHEWGGPAWCPEELAVAMDFENLSDFFGQRDRLASAIESGRPLSRRDWHRMLLATEIVFISDVVGSGHDWNHTVGITDEETLHVLRSLQRKLPWSRTILHPPPPQ
jgi:hypothetical protein